MLGIPYYRRAMSEKSPKQLKWLLSVVAVVLASVIVIALEVAR